MAKRHIDVKEAISIAIGFLTERYNLQPDEKPRLEETIHEENGRWLITLSFKQTGVFEVREYKTFEIDDKTGESIAMRIREPAVIDAGEF